MVSPCQPIWSPAVLIIAKPARTMLPLSQLIEAMRCLSVPSLDIRVVSYVSSALDAEMYGLLQHTFTLTQQR